MRSHISAGNAINALRTQALWQNTGVSTRVKDLMSAVNVINALCEKMLWQDTGSPTRVRSHKMHSVQHGLYLQRQIEASHNKTSGKTIIVSCFCSHLMETPVYRSALPSGHDHCCRIKWLSARRLLTVILAKAGIHSSRWIRAFEGFLRCYHSGIGMINI